MEINSLGYLNMDDYRTNAMRNTRNPQNSFEEIVRRTAADGNKETVISKIENKPIDKEDELYKLCLELETFIVKNLLSGMRNTVQKSGLVDDSFAGKIYEDMLWDEYAKSYTQNAGFGLAEQAYRQLKNYY